MSVTDAHRLFLQVLMAQSAVEAENAINIAQECSAATESGNDLSKSDFLAFIRAINDGLKTVAMKIGQVKSQVTGDTYFAVVNQVGDSIAERATIHKAYTDYIRLLIETITFGQPDGTISRNDALHLRIELKGPVKGLYEINTLLDTLAEDLWLEKIPAEKFTLGPRSILELPVFLKDSHASRVAAGDDIQAIADCAFCKNMCVYGHRCHSCDTRSCFPCLKKAFPNSSTLECPNDSCREPWDKPHEIQSNVESVATAAVASADSSSQSQGIRTPARQGGVKNVKTEPPSEARSSKRTRRSK
eukprot:m.215167 g.215167  ORF g.215167 m.215167 type:complete len:302 (-) comp19084_c0_seq1:1111-2016(-)